MNEIAILGAGCFWCTEATFQNIKGVVSVTSGYCGGMVPHPTSNQVYEGKTGHAEVARIEFDPQIISYKQLLEVFFVTHNPTTHDRQGNDVGDEYRSVIFYLSEDQRKTAEEAKSDLDSQHVYKDPIVTEISPAQVFYPAENYHQNFYNNNPYQSYCQVVIDPKLAKLREKFSSLLKDVKVI